MDTWAASQPCLEGGQAVSQSPSHPVGCDCKGKMLRLVSCRAAQHLVSVMSEGCQYKGWCLHGSPVHWVCSSLRPSCLGEVSCIPSDMQIVPNSCSVG